MQLTVHQPTNHTILCHKLQLTPSLTINQPLHGAIRLANQSEPSRQQSSTITMNAITITKTWAQPSPNTINHERFVSNAKFSNHDPSTINGLVTFSNHQPWMSNYKPLTNHHEAHHQLTTIMNHRKPIICQPSTIAQQTILWPIRHHEPWNPVVSDDRCSLPLCVPYDCWWIYYSVFHINDWLIIIIHI